MSTTRKVRTTASGLVIRSLPMVADATDTGKRLTPGQVATVYGRSLDSGWLYLVAPAGSGWASAAHLVDASAAPAKPRWRVAKALDQLLAQINADAPGRSKGYDGSIGDEAHQERASDHNPDEDGVVRARDFTNDPRGGCDCAKLARALVASRDPRIGYIIFSGIIWRSYARPASGARKAVAAWEAQPYHGANQHFAHMHVSVVADPKLYDDTRPWSIG